MAKNTWNRNFVAKFNRLNKPKIIPDKRSKILSRIEQTNMKTYKNIIEVYTAIGKLDLWKRNSRYYIETGVDTIELSKMELNDLILGLKELANDGNN
jgi:hypothetical protein